MRACASAAWCAAAGPNSNPLAGKGDLAGTLTTTYPPRRLQVVDAPSLPEAEASYAIAADGIVEYTG